MRRFRLYIWVCVLFLIAGSMFVVFKINHKENKEGYIINGEQSGKKIAVETEITVETSLIKKCFANIDFSEEHKGFHSMDKYAVGEKGCYYMAMTGSAIQYYDAENDQIIYVCNKPDCSHGSENCDAYYDGSITNLFIYGGKLFVCVGVENDIKMYVSDLDGTNRKKILECKNASIEQCYLVEEKMYLAYCLYGENGSHDTMRACVSCINLKNGSEKMIVTFEADESHYRNWVGFVLNDERNKLCMEYEYVDRILSMEDVMGDAVIYDEETDNYYINSDYGESEFDEKFDTYVREQYQYVSAEIYEYNLEQDTLKQLDTNLRGIQQSVAMWQYEDSIYILNETMIDGLHELYKDGNLVAKFEQSKSFRVMDDYLYFVVYDEANGFSRRCLYNITNDDFYVSKKSCDEGAAEILGYSDKYNLIAYDRNTDYSQGLIIEDVRRIGVENASTYIEENYMIYENRYLQIHFE